MHTTDSLHSAWLALLADLSAVQRARAETSLQRLNVWVGGGARSGVAVALLLHKAGAQVFVSDQGSLPPEARTALLNAGIAFEEKGHSIELFRSQAQLLVLSPAIPLNKGLAFIARQEGIPIASEIEIASWFARPTAHIVGITGTNGKSTTTNYFAQLMNRAGRSCVACGNFGHPFAAAVLDTEAYTLFSLELSSYQLETTLSLRPRVSLLLNLQNDHLLRYGTLDEYLKAKWRLVLSTADDGCAVIEIGVFAHAQRIGLPLPRCQVVLLGPQVAEAWNPDTNSNNSNNSGANRSSIEKVRPPLRSKATELPSQLKDALAFSQTLPHARYSELCTLPAAAAWPETTFGEASYLWNPQGGKLSVRLVLPGKDGQPAQRWDHHITTPCLPGEHNVQNILAASAAALFLGAPADLVFLQWEESTSHYNHLPHRLERVGGPQALFYDATGQAKKVALINDSKATNVESTLVALNSFASGVRLLLGGEPKGESFLPLARYLGKSVIRVYPFGKAGPLIAQELAAFGIHLAPPSAGLKEAAMQALSEAQPLETVLLSPACASFDEFKNFEHRGDTFREWAEAQRCPVQPEGDNI